MKRKIWMATAAGVSLVLFSSLNSSNSPTYQSDAIQANDWLIIGSPSTTFTPGSGSLSVGGKATGNNATAIGASSTATANHSIAIGRDTNAGGYRSVALGYGAIASGPNSVAAGWYAWAVGYNAVAFGLSRSEGYASTSFGIGTAGGLLSTAFGYASALGNSSVAMGHSVYATGRGTVAIGQSNDVGSYDELIHSQSQIHPDGHLFVVGNGDAGSATRSNALVTTWDGSTTLINKHWDDAAPLDDTGTQTNEALVVKGHALLEGKVVMKEAQGDISMGIYGPPTP